MKLPLGYSDFESLHGVSLSTINPGSKEVAFPRDIAVLAINCLCGSSIAVLGGDIMKVSNDTLEYAYENWYCQKNQGESEKDYASRSIGEAKKYVEDFVGVGGYEPLFVFVLSENS